MGGGISGKGKELVSVRIREWARRNSGESREKATVGPEEPGHSPLAAGSPAPGWERVDLGVTSSQQYPEQALPIKGELQPMDCGLPRMQLGAEADGWQEG